MPSRPRLRFAPSPNGRLHLGHAYSALFTWAMAAQLGGEALLRIEDIDLMRCKPEFDAAILEDLAWIGLEWPEPVLRQATRFDAYRAASEALCRHSLLYPCFCTRRQIAERATERDPDGAPLYPRTCRNLPATEQEARLAAGEPVQWRLKMDRGLDEAGALWIAEMNEHGSGQPGRPADPAPWGDAVLIRKDIPTSYHLSVVVDDTYQGITHVTRGTDLYPATALHCLLQALLDLPSPVYCHHRLIAGDDRMKLSKSRDSESLRGLRESGWTPHDIRDALGFTLPSRA